LVEELREEGIGDPIEKYAAWNSLDVNENANRNMGPSSFFSYLLEEYMYKFVELLPKPVLKAHISGYIYVHKLPYSVYIPYCSGHSIARLLKIGLKTPTVISRPARHFDTFVDHVANYLITLQHYFTGAQALSSVEWYAGPFIRYDNLSFVNVKQNVQRLLFNLNYPTRIGLQTPFTNFTITLDAPRKMVEEDRAIYGGVEAEPLGAYYDEAKTFFLALTKLYGEGDASGQPFTFPIPTLMTTAKMIWSEPEVYEAVFKVAAVKGSFYWLNTRVVDPDAAFAMCCRLTIDRNELVNAYRSGGYSLSSLKRDVELLREEYFKNIERQRFGGLWAVPDTTGSVNVTTINLPRIALEAGGDDTRFWELYEQVLGIVKVSENWFRSRYVKLMNNYPGFYSMVKTYIPEFPSTYFNTVGLIGLPEAAAILLREPRLWREGSRRDWLRAADLMKKIVRFAVEHARKWMSEDGVPWNVEEVPGESAAAKLALKDAKLYPEVLEYLGDPGNPIYSTSIAPYYGSLELPDRVEVESRVQREFTGGVMMHIFLGEEPDPDALAKLTKRLMETDLVYWSYTPALTYCSICEKTYTGLYTTCPKCGSDSVEVWSRIIGYYRPLRNWNPYRRREFWTRRHYKL